MVRQRVEGILEFYSRLADWYDLMYLAQGVKPVAYDPETVGAFDTLIRDLRATNVLDCACGTGDPVLGLFKVPDRAYQLAASDGSEGMLSSCRRNAANEGIPVTDNPSASNLTILPLISCTWASLPAVFGADRFDFLMCVGHGFYHLDTREALVDALKAMVQVVTTGGWVLFDTLRWRYDESGRACGEEGRDLVKWRGWLDLNAAPDLRLKLPPEVDKNINKILFLDSTSYYPSDRTVGGVIQTKTVFVFGEKDNELRQLARLSATGAAFSADEAMKLLTEAGLQNVRQFEPKEHPSLTRRVMVMGKKESWRRHWMTDST